MVMASGFDFGKKMTNFDARRTLMNDLPFLLHALLPTNHPTLQLTIIYLSFRNLVEEATVTDVSKKEVYERLRNLFCLLYNQLIGPHLKMKSHPKIHRIEKHLSWDAISQFGCFGEWRTKTGESLLKPYKVLWHDIGGASLENFNRAIIRSFNTQYASMKRPLHLEQKSAPFHCDKIIAFKISKRLNGVRSSSLSLLNPVQRISILETAEKLRMPGTDLPISRDCFVKLYRNDPNAGSDTRYGVVLEFLFNCNFWQAMISLYQYEGRDEIMFNLKSFRHANRVILIDLREYKIKKKSMIPNLRCIISDGRFVNSDVPVDIPKIWLRSTKPLVVDIQKLVDVNSHLQCLERASVTVAEPSGLQDNDTRSSYEGEDHQNLTYETATNSSQDDQFHLEDGILSRIDELSQLLSMTTLSPQEKIEVALDHHGICESLLAEVLLDEPRSKRFKVFEDVTLLPADRSSRRKHVDYRALNSGSSR